MKRILCALPDTNDCIAWWRGWMPMLDVKRFGTEVAIFDFMTNRTIGWHTIEDCDVVYMSRPFLRDHLTVLSMAKKAEKKVWVDYDDDYWAIPEWNWASMVFGQQALATLQTAAQLADVVTVSTEPLAKRVRAFTGAPIHVIPNAFPNRYKWPAKERTKTVLYRGGWKTHSGDLKSVADQFQRVVTDFPDWTFMCATQGHPVMIDGPNMRFAGDLSLPEFHSWIQDLAPSVLVNPLEFSDFNRSKSNIAWMEGTLAGAAVLCPELPQYIEPGCTTYEPGKFEERLREMLAMNDEDRAALVALSQETIDAKYRLSVASKQRWGIMCAL